MTPVTQYIFDGSGWQSETRASSRLAAATTTASDYISGWGTPVWRDEFGGSTVDLAKWTVKDNAKLSQDYAVTHAANAKIINSQLHMITDRLATPITTADGHRRLMSTVYMDTNKKFSQRYGRWEARMNLGMNRYQSSGMWPSLWMRDDVGGKGEIDIFEALGSPHTKSSIEPYGSFSSTLHRDTSHVLKERWQAGARKIPDGTDIGVGWHTFAFEWKPTGMKFIVDGHVLNTVSSSSLWWYKEAFSSPFSIRLCVQWGDMWAMPSLARPEDMITSARTIVDYIRVWKYPGY